MLRNVCISVTDKRLKPLCMLVLYGMIHRVEHIEGIVNKVVSGMGPTPSNPGGPSKVSVDVTLVYKWLSSGIDLKPRNDCDLRR